MAILRSPLRFVTMVTKADEFFCQIERNLHRRGWEYSLDQGADLSNLHGRLLKDNEGGH